MTGDKETSSKVFTMDLTTALNNSTHATEAPQWTSGLAAHTKITLWSILLVWSLLGNVFVIAVVYCNQNLRTNVNYLVVNMAVSDLLVPLIALPWMISHETVRPFEWLVEGTLGEALCKIIPLLSEIPAIVSSINVVNIAFQRFIAVVYPARRHILTPKKRWILIFFPWIVAMVLYSPYFYTYRLKKEQGYTMCYLSWSAAEFDTMTVKVTFFSILSTVAFVIPLITIIILYTTMHYKLRRSLNNIKGAIEREMTRSRQRRNRRIFNMSLTIIVMFAICWCPLVVLSLLYAVNDPSLNSMDQGTYLDIVFAFFYMWYFLTAINPCIYFLFLTDFRQGLKGLCCRAPEHVQTWINNARRTRTPGGDGNQYPTRTPPHISTTSV